jgi:hypothetical protein
VGLRFLNVPASSQELLEGWLNDQMEQQIPGSKGKLAGTGFGPPSIEVFSW